jgi:hypothetical protein
MLSASVNVVQGGTERHEGVKLGVLQQKITSGTCDDEDR